MKRKDTGNLGEKLAAGHLKKRGYKILDTNFRCPRGEIDIIARHRNTLVFVEVRSKANLRFGSPEESITFAKRRHLRASASYYLQSHKDLQSDWRIDVVAIELDNKGEVSRIEIIENAVGEE
jgi:putative endonuclease